MPSISSAFSVESIVSGIAKQLQEITATLLPLNILSVGRPNSDKLVLLKQLFGPRYFDRDHFCQYSQGVIRYQKDNHPLCIYQTDIQGDSFSGLNTNLNLIRTCAQDSKTALNLIIFHLGDNWGHVENWEYDAVKQISLQQEIPILVVLDSKASSTTLEYTQKLFEELEESFSVQYAIAKEKSELCAQIMELLPEAEVSGIKDKILPPPSVKDTFIHLERLDYAAKEKKVNGLISKAANATAAEAAISPIPDWIVMAPTEAIMMAGINSYFEVRVSKRLIKTLLPAVLGTGAATIAGKAASDVLGRIPILTGVGAVVDAATAKTITHLIGIAYYQLLLAIERNEISEDELGSKAGAKKLKQLIKSNTKGAK